MIGRQPERRKKPRWLHIYDRAVGTVCLFGFAYFLYLAKFERPWLRYPHLPMPVITKRVRVGDTVHIWLYRCSSKTETQQYFATRSLIREGVDPIFHEKYDPILLPTKDSHVDPGCTKVPSLGIVIPVGTEPGKYHTQGVGKIGGTVRRFQVPWISETFEVIP